MSQQLWAMRHGETVWNAAGLLQGHADAPLTGVGRDQAREAGELLGGEGIERIVASDLGRTLATASIVAERLGLRVESSAAWRELDMGPALEGRPVAEIEALPGYERRPDWRFPGGESLADLRERVMAGLAAIADEGRATLVVTHAGPLRVLLALARGVPFAESLELKVPQQLVARFDARGVGLERAVLLRP